MLGSKFSCPNIRKYQKLKQDIDLEVGIEVTALKTSRYHSLTALLILQAFKVELTPNGMLS